MKLTLENWYSHAKATLASGARVTMIVGENGVGKTAVRDAVEFLFLGTGLLRGIGTKKDLAAFAIRTGAAECAVTLEGETIRLRRTMNAKAQQLVTRERRENPSAKWSEPEPIPVANAVQFLLGRVVAEDVLRALLDPFAFERLEPTRRREMLIQATSTGAPADAIAKALGARFPNAQASEILAIAEMAAEHGFRHAEQTVVQARREAKRAAEAPAFEAPDPKAEGVDLAAGTLAEFQAHLAGIREAHTAAVAREASSVAKLEGELAALEARQRTLLEPGEPYDLEAAELAEANARGALAAAEAALADAGRGLEATERSARAVSADPPAQCPAMPPGISWACPVKPAAFRKPLEATAAIQQQAAEALPEARATHSEAHTAMETARRTLRAATDALAQARERDRAATAALGELEGLESRINGLAAQITRAKAAPAAEPGQSAAELSARVQKGERIVEGKRRYDAAVAAIGKADAARAEAKAKVEWLDALAKALAPDGVEMSLGGAARAAFLAAAGKAIRLLAGEVELTPEFELRCGGRHPTQLSLSQRMALGVALQHALAAAADFPLPLLMTDALDTFDQPHRAAWFGFAKWVAEHYPLGVWGLATTSGEPGQPPEGSATIWLRAGEAPRTLGEVGF